MAKVKHVKARKDYPDSNIKKGEMYYYCARKTGPRSSIVMRQKEPFKRQQLTGSPFKKAVYDIEDAIAQLQSIEDLEAVKTMVEELQDEMQCSLDNMPEGLQMGHTGELLQERIDACEEAYSALDEVQSEWESAVDEHAESEHQDEEPEVQQYIDAAKEVGIEC